MKKISTLLVVIILFNFIFSNFSFAIEEVENQEADYSREAYDKLADEGRVTLNDSEVKLSASTSSVGSASGITASIFSPIFMICSLALSKVANDGGIYRTDSDYSAANNFWFTVSSLVFGEYLLFNGKIYETTESLNSSVPQTGVSKLMDTIKNKAMGWFEVLKTIGLALFLVLIIYSGSRLLAAVIAEERARWKKIIFIWAIGLILVFFIRPIVVSLNEINDNIMNVLYNARISLENSGHSSFEVSVLTTALTNYSNVGGLKALAYALEYTAFVIIEISFFFKYFVRALKLIILVVISPIIFVLNGFYQIAGKDLDITIEWFKQYLSNLAMQPFHATIYLIFMFAASEIAVNAPLLALVFLWALLRAEAIIKLMLNLNMGKLGTLFSGKK